MDSKALRALELYEEAVWQITGGVDPEGQAYLHSFLYPDSCGPERDLKSPVWGSSGAEYPYPYDQLPQRRNWELGWEWWRKDQPNNQWSMTGMNLLQWFTPWHVRQRLEEAGEESKQEASDSAGTGSMSASNCASGASATNLSDLAGLSLDEIISEAETLLQDWDEPPARPSPAGSSGPKPTRNKRSTAASKREEPKVSRIRWKSLLGPKAEVEGFSILVVGLCSVLRSVSSPRLRAGVVSMIGRLAMHVSDAIRTEVRPCCCVSPAMLFLDLATACCTVFSCFGS